MKAVRRLWAWFWFQPYVLLTLTMLLWAGNAIASRLARGNISPMALTNLRWVFVCTLLVFLLRRDLKAKAPELLKSWRLLVMMGTFGFTAFNTIMYVAAYQTTAINIGLIQGAIPVFVLLGALIAHGTRVTGLQIAGVVVTLIGVAFVAAKGDVHVLAALGFNQGDMMMVVACSFYASYTVALRERPAVPGLVFFTALAVVACAVSIPLFIWEIMAGQFFWPTAAGYGIILYVGLGPSLSAQLFFIRGVELIGPGRAGIFANAVPVFAAMLAVLILGEPFSWYHAAALVLVLGGIAIAETGKRGLPSGVPATPDGVKAGEG